MTQKFMIAGAALISVALAAVAHAQWAPPGWGIGHGGGAELGRTEGPVTVDLWANQGGSSLSITVTGCGGLRDFRSFGTDISGGDGQNADAAAALNRLLGEAGRACGFEPRLASRIAEGFGPAFDSWLADQAAMLAEMNSADMNWVECSAEECNAM